MIAGCQRVLVRVNMFQLKYITIIFKQNFDKFYYTIYYLIKVSKNVKKNVKIILKLTPIIV